MEPATIQPLSGSNACSNCGANLEYDFTTNTNKCPYCGSAFKTSKSTEHSTTGPAPDAGCIRFRNDLSKFRDAVITFLSTGDKTPVNLLFEAEFLPSSRYMFRFISLVVPILVIITRLIITEKYLVRTLRLVAIFQFRFTAVKVRRREKTWRSLAIVSTKS